MNTKNKKEFEKILKRIGLKIKQHRINKGFKKVDFSRLPYSVSLTSYKKIETGRANCNLQTLYLISKKLDCDIKDLL